MTRQLVLEAVNVPQLCGFSSCSDGFKFYRSSNNVILCPGNERGFLPPEYFERVVQTRPSKFSIFTYILMYDCKSTVSFCRSHLMPYSYHPATWSGRVQEGLNLGFSRLQNKHRSYALRHSVYLFWAHLCCRYDYFIVLFRERIAFFCHLIIVTNRQRW